MKGSMVIWTLMSRSVRLNSIKGYEPKFIGMKGQEMEKNRRERHKMLIKFVRNMRTYSDDWQTFLENSQGRNARIMRFELIDTNLKLVPLTNNGALWVIY